MRPAQTKRNVPQSKRDSCYVHKGSYPLRVVQNASLVSLVESRQFLQRAAVVVVKRGLPFVSNTEHIGPPSMSEQCGNV